jgi:hypothetical protein
LNRRDEQIRALKERTAGLDAERLQHCREVILRAYEAATIVDRVSRVVEISDRTPSDFIVLSNSEARRVAHFNGRNSYWDMYCEQLGRSVALGEERYLFDRMGQVPRSDLTVNAENPEFGVLLDAARHLTSRGYRPDVVFAPRSLFVPFAKALPIDWQASGRQALLIPGGQAIQVFWSGLSGSPNRFVMFDSRRGVWTVKLDPDTHQRLTVAIGQQESQPQAVTFLAETVVKYEIEDPEGFLAVEVEGLPPQGSGDDNGRTQTRAEA